MKATTILPITCHGTENLWYLLQTDGTKIEPNFRYAKTKSNYDLETV